MCRLLALATAWLVSSCAVGASVSATWDHDGIDVDGFKLRYECQSEVATKPAGPSARALTLTVPDGESCSAKMWAYNEVGDSEPSNTVTFSTPALERPGQVRNLRISWSEPAAEQPPMAIGTDIIFADNFNQPNGPMGAGWVFGGPSQADFIISNNAVALDLDGTNIPGAKYMLVDNPAMEGVNAAIQFRTSTRVWGVFRLSGSGTNVTAYLVGRNGSNYEFARWKNGVFSTLQSAYVGSSWSGATLTAECETVGSNVVLRIKSSNNSTVYTYTDSSADKILEGDGFGFGTTVASPTSSMMLDDFILFGTAGGGGPDPDEEAPTLTVPGATPTDYGNTADVTVTTDENNGVLRMVTTASVTKPSKPQMKAGQDHTGADALMLRQQAVTAAGVQTIHTAVPIGTGRYFHLMHTDAAGNDSDVVTAGPFDTAFGQVFFDNFARPDGPLNTNWDVIYGAPAILNQQVVPGAVDQYNQSAAAVSAAALPAVPQAYSVEIRASNFIDNDGEDAAGLSMGTTVAAEGVFAGVLLFLDGDSITLMLWDDVGESWTTLATGPVTENQASKRMRGGLAVESNGDVRITGYSMADGAKVLDYTIPSTSVPGYITEWRPGLGFYDEDGSPLWVENYGVYAMPAGDLGAITGAGDALATFLASAAVHEQASTSSAGDAQSIHAATATTYEQASTTSTTTAQAALLPTADTHATLTAAAAPVAGFADAPQGKGALAAPLVATSALATTGTTTAALTASTTAASSYTPLAHVLAQLAAAADASDSADQAATLVAHLLEQGSGDAAFDGLYRATAALLAGAAAGEAWAAQATALADLLAQVSATSRFATDASEFRPVDLTENASATSSTSARADTAAALLADLQTAAAFTDQTTARAALLNALNAVATWSAGARTLDHAQLQVMAAAAAQLTASAEGIEQAALEEGTEAAVLFLSAVQTDAATSAHGSATATVLAFAATQGAITAVADAQAQWVAQESANLAALTAAGDAQALVAAGDVHATADLLASSPALTLLQAFAVTQEQGEVAAPGTATATFHLASTMAGDFVAAVSPAGLFSPSDVLIRTGFTGEATAAAFFSTIYTAPAGALTGSLRVFSAMTGAMRSTPALASSVGADPALVASIH